MRRGCWVALVALASLTGCWGDGPTGPGSTIAPPLPQFAGEWGVNGIGPGQLQNPHGIAINDRGQVFIADLENHRVQKFTASGEFLQAIALEQPRFDEPPAPRDVALDSNGRLYVADIQYDRIDVFDSAGRPAGSWGTRGTNPGELYRPIAIAISGGSIFVADGVERVQRFDLQGHYETGWPLYDGSIENYPNVFDLEADRHGNVWVVENSQARIRRFSPDGELQLTLNRAGATPGAFQSPLALALDPQGNLLVAEEDTGRVQMFDERGRFLAQWPMTPHCASRYGSTPVSMAVTHAGRILIVDAHGSRVLQFEAPSQPGLNYVWTTWGQYGQSPGALYQPRGIAIDSDNHVYVCDNVARVSVFTAEGSFIRQFGTRGSGAGELGLPYGVTTFEDRVYVSDLRNVRVSVFDRAGNPLGDWALANGPAGERAAPHGIATDKDGNVYVCATGTRIDVFSPEGMLLRSWGQEGQGPGQFTNAVDVGVASDDTVFVVDTFRRAVQRFDTHGVYAGDLAELPLEGGPLVALDVGPDDYVFVAATGRLYDFDSNGHWLVIHGGPGHCAYQFDIPGDLAGDHTGRLFVTDFGNARVESSLRIYPSFDPGPTVPTPPRSWPGHP